MLPCNFMDNFSMLPVKLCLFHIISPSFNLNNDSFFLSLQKVPHLHCSLCFLSSWHMNSTFCACNGFIFVAFVPEIFYSMFCACNGFKHTLLYTSMLENSESLYLGETSDRDWFTHFIQLLLSMNCDKYLWTHPTCCTKEAIFLSYFLHYIKHATSYWNNPFLIYFHVIINVFLFHTWYFTVIIKKVWCNMYIRG